MLGFFHQVLSACGSLASTVSTTTIIYWCLGTASAVRPFERAVTAADAAEVASAASNMTMLMPQEAPSAAVIHKGAFNPLGNISVLLQESQKQPRNDTSRLAPVLMDAIFVPRSRTQVATMTAKGSILPVQRRVLLQEDEALFHDASLNGRGKKANLSKAELREVLTAALRARRKKQPHVKASPAEQVVQGEELGGIPESEVISELLDSNTSDTVVFPADDDGDHRYVITIPEKMLYPLDQAISNENHGPTMRMLLALGGGTGASIGGTGSLLLDKDLARRMRMQDEAVMMLLIGVYFVTLFFSASLAYRQATNTSPVTYYADPRYYNHAVEGNDVEVFLESFNQPPKSVLLRVAGFTPVAEESPGSINWRGDSYTVNFTFALDLSPWVVRESDDYSVADATLDPASRVSQLHEGIAVQDLGQLEHALEHDNNDLSTVNMYKEVAWSNWEELATNIKSQIRQCGFEGVVGIERTPTEDMVIYKNRPWANFMHSKTLKVILALSIVGWAAYIPYLWARTTRLVVRSYYRVDISINDYWRLIRDNLSANGFDVPQEMGVGGMSPAVVAASAAADAAVEWSSEGGDSEAFDPSEDAASNQSARAA